MTSNSVKYYLEVDASIHQRYFTSSPKAINLVTTLRNFAESLESKIECSNNTKGNRTLNFIQVVNTNLPEKINLTTPIINGAKPETIEVENIDEVDRQEVTFILISPAVQEIIDMMKNMAIYRELEEKVRERPISQLSNNKHHFLQPKGLIQVRFLSWEQII